MDHKAMRGEAERSWTIERVDQQTERILQASEADADAERRAFLKAFEADDQERRRDEALESALRAYEHTRKFRLPLLPRDPRRPRPTKKREITSEGRGEVGRE